MRWGTVVAIGMCVACGCAAAPRVAAEREAGLPGLQQDVRGARADSLPPPAAAAQDTAGLLPSRADSAGAARDTVWAADVPVVPPGPVAGPLPLRFQVQMAAYKSPWELLALLPEVRWAGGSGALGGVEACSIRGRLMRRPGLLYDGVPLGPDLNTVGTANLDSVSIMAGVPLHSEVLMNGADGVEAVSDACAGGPQEVYVSLSKGEIGSKFNALNYKRCAEAWRFRLNLAGASYGRAASYEAYTRDGGDLSAERDFGSGLSAGLRVVRFRSKLIRYTGNKTKTRLTAVELTARKEERREAAWGARTYFVGSEYSYMDVGPQSEDDIWSAGCAVDLWPMGSDGAHRLSLGLRRESLERSIRPFVVPAELEAYGVPDQGTRRSVDASGAYVLTLARGESRLTGLARVDRKDLFGWSPTFAVSLRRALGSWGSAVVEGQRSSFMPDFLEIYAPRDETAGPSWYMARATSAETEWSACGRLEGARGRWTGSVAGFGARREHVLAPPAEWLGLNGEAVPAIAPPVEDAGSGSAIGATALVRWDCGSALAMGGAYSVQRSRVEGEPAPFQPAQKGELWVRGERPYFGGDMKLGVVLRGWVYSAQPTYLESELPSFGAADATGYLSISDVVFYYQIKNLETRPRPSPILDLESGRYLLQPGPEVRFGLVWYLPG
jgi:hypothetical protein